ncbi:hypothetical protein [Streptomyces sp. URMC 124]
MDCTHPQLPQPTEHPGHPVVDQPATVDACRRDYEQGEAERTASEHRDRR